MGSVLSSNLQIEALSLVGNYRLKNKTENFKLSEYRLLPVRYIRFLLVYLTLLSLSSSKSYLKIKLLLHPKFSVCAL